MLPEASWGYKAERYSRIADFLPAHRYIVEAPEQHLPLTYEAKTPLSLGNTQSVSFQIHCSSLTEICFCCYD